MARLNSFNGIGFALRDYHHAAKTFTSSSQFDKIPYSGFLFHVNISFNSVTAGSEINTQNISVLVKAADLPEVRFETETLNQYNRKRIINKKVEYQPIKLTFHDDVASNVRNMWIAYNQHYSADSIYVDENTWQLDNIYQTEGISRPYGLDNGTVVPFINKIEIFSMGNRQYSKLLLVNPVISSASFGSHEYSAGNSTMEMVTTIEYENIIYSTGSNTRAPGFGLENTQNYDVSRGTIPESVVAGRVGNDIFFQQSVPQDNTPVVPQVLNISEIQARQLDTTPGNVSGNVPKSDNQNYNSLKQNIVNQTTTDQRRFLFPDTVEVATDRPGLSVTNALQENSIVESRGDQRLSRTPFGTSQDTVSQIVNSTVGQSVDISSNGENISVFRTTPGVRTTRVVSANLSDPLSELIISPKVPDALTSAERVLFSRSFPPLPSTDPRARKPPYI